MNVRNAMPTSIMKVPIHAGADIAEGALIMPGVTHDSDISAFILASGAAANAIGVLASLYDFSVEGTSAPETGVTYVLHEIIKILPGSIVDCEYDQTSTITTGTYTAGGVTLAIGSLEDNIDGSWFYSVAGTGLGQLMYVIGSAAGTATLKEACTTALSTDTTFIKILREGHALLTLNSAGTKLGTAAAAGALTWKVLHNEITYDGMEGWERLDPTKHSGLSGLDTKHVRFRAVLAPRSTFFGLS